MKTARKARSANARAAGYTFETLPPLTQAQLDHRKAPAARPDTEIDLSDISEVTEEQFRRAPRCLLYRPVKRQITARVDADVLEWLKSQGKGCQSRINAILHREMLAGSRQR